MSYLLEQAVLVLLLHLSIFLDLLGDLCNLGLELLTGGLTISHELLILCNVPLQVIEHLELLIESNQGVQLVLELNLLLLERKLELIFIALVEHSRGEFARYCCLGGRHSASLSRARTCTPHRRAGWSR